MRFAIYIARRYLFSKKSHNVINIISFISMVGVGIGSLALIVVLSAFNGLQDLVEGLYSSFDPDIEITIKSGKTFAVDSFPMNQITQAEGVAHFTRVLEENVLLKYRDRQTIATVKGVEAQFLEMSGLDSMVFDGALVLEQDSIMFAVMGYGIAANLSVYIESALEPIKVHAAKRTMTVSLDPGRAFRKRNIMAAGIFSINPDFDDKYFLVPYTFAEELLDYPGRVTGIEIGLEPGENADRVKKQLQQIVGDEYTVKTRYEQNELIFKTNKIEKWITYLILSFILVIATFNVIGSLTMLIIDKKQDIFVLKSMGACRQVIRRIFLIEGLLINLIGGLMGLGLGALLCWFQITFGLVRLEGTIVEYYPVQMRPLDFLAVLGTVIVIGFFSSWFPVRLITKRHF